MNKEIANKIYKLEEKIRDLQMSLGAYDSICSQISRIRIGVKKDTELNNYDKQRILELQERLKRIKFDKDIIEEIDALTREKETLMIKLNTIDNAGVLKGELIGRWKYDFKNFKLECCNGTWYIEDVYTVGTSYVITELNTDNIPTSITKYVQNSDTLGQLMTYHYKIELDILPVLNEIVKPLPKPEIQPFTRDKLTIPDKILDTTQIKDYSVDEQMKIIVCPRCNVEIRLGTLAKYHVCSNCGLTESEVYQKLRENKTSKR